MTKGKWQRARVWRPRRNVGASKPFTFYLLPFTYGRGRGGFTIIELLVVVAIIGLLTALGFALFSEARTKSRDAKREKDVKTLQDALSIYVTNASAYPVTDTNGVYLTGSDAVASTLIAAGALPAVPLDPQNVGNFRYKYTSTDGFTYTLIYYLETNSIPGKSAGEHTASP